MLGPFGEAWADSEIDGGGLHAACQTMPRQWRYPRQAAELAHRHETCVKAVMLSSSLPSDHVLHVGCCIVGGGPAGLMLGLLLARAGVRVAVLEKEADFTRDFRGDVLHPSTLEVLHELGLLSELLQLPHQRLEQLDGIVFGERRTVADFSHLRAQAPFVALMAPWVFLEFLAGAARRYGAFELYLESEVTDLIAEHGRVGGVVVKTPRGFAQVHAGLIVGADGRESVLRELAELPLLDLGAPVDVLWLRLSRAARDPERPFGYVSQGQMLTLLNRGTYWQCALTIKKGSYEGWKRYDVHALRERVAHLAPFLSERVAELSTWDDVRLLHVRVNRLERWAREGVLCIGDAAHGMSPIGGVGVNLAIDDAVATANVLADALKRNAPLPLSRLRRVQRRRQLPTVLTQKLQVALQDRLIGRAFSSSGSGLTQLLRCLELWPPLRRIPGRLFGVGLRPEHVHGLGATGGRRYEPA